MPGDLVLDPFAGSNTTGAVCEKLQRRWIALEENREYLEGSRLRFWPELGKVAAPVPPEPAPAADEPPRPPVQQPPLFEDR